MKHQLIYLPVIAAIVLTICLFVFVCFCFTFCTWQLRKVESCVNRDFGSDTDRPHLTDLWYLFCLNFCCWSLNTFCTKFFWVSHFPSPGNILGLRLCKRIKVGGGWGGGGQKCSHLTLQCYHQSLKQFHSLPKFIQNWAPIPLSESSVERLVPLYEMCLTILLYTIVLGCVDSFIVSIHYTVSLL